MRIEQSEAEFKPITIHLDSQSEVDAFLEVVQTAYNNTSGGSDAERLAIDLRDKLREHGWQSSSYNC